MACNYSKPQGQEMTFTQFQAECISMFDLHTKLPKIYLPQTILACLEH